MSPDKYFVNLRHILFLKLLILRLLCSYTPHTLPSPSPLSQTISLNTSYPLKSVEFVVIDWQIPPIVFHLSAHSLLRGNQAIVDRTSDANKGSRPFANLVAVYWPLLATNITEIPKNNVTFFWNHLRSEARHSPNPSRSSKLRPIILLKIVLRGTLIRYTVE